MIRIAFVKYAGLAAGGTERWLQTIAAYLPRDEFIVDYFYADAVPYVMSNERVLGTDPCRRRWMEARGVNLIEFHLDAVDDRVTEKRWINSNFGDVFDETRYDLVQTAKEGLAEYPYTRLKVPVFEQVAYTSGVDRSAMTIRSGFWSQWHRSWWVRRGGDVSRSFVTPMPVSMPESEDDLRDELGIPRDDLVVGFHQRQSDRSFSAMQLEALGQIARKDVHLVVLGGSIRYQEQAGRIGLSRCHFLTPTADGVAISRFLNTLDVFIHGRRDGETFGAVLAEALMHGLPCLSHRVRRGGNAQHETIGPGGAVVNDVKAYRRELMGFLDDEGLRARVGARGQEHARNRYSVEAAVFDMADRYRTFVTGRGRNRVATSTVPYGEEPGGLLLAGPIEDAQHPANSVLTGRPARRLAVRILQSEIRCQSMVEVGADRSFLALVAGARGCRSHIVDLGSGAERATWTVWLNGLDDQVAIGSTVEASDFGEPVILAVTDDPLAKSWIQRRKQMFGPSVPVVLFERPTSNEMRRALRASGYSRYGLAGEQVYVHRSMRDRPSGTRLWAAVASTCIVGHARATEDALVRWVEPKRSSMRGPVKAYLGTPWRWLSRGIRL